MRKVRVPIFMVVAVFFAATSALANNGSSGIGSARFPLTDGIAAVLPPTFAQVQGNQVNDGAEPILAISTISRSDLGAGWRPAHLGRIHGFEYLPEVDSAELNAWAICRYDSDICTKFTPLSKSNRKIPAIVGSLIRTH